MIAEVLERYGVDLSEQDVADLLEETFAGEARVASTGLTGDERDFVAKYAGVPSAATAGASPRRSAAERVRAELGSISRSVSTNELADRWGVDRSRVRHRAAERTLYAIRVGRHLRFPLWQFDEQLRPIPGLARVIKALPAGLHPLEVEGWVTTPNENLIVNDQPVSVHDWLVGQGDPRVVVALAQTVDRW